MSWAWEVVLGGVDVANPLASSLGWADSAGGLREELPWRVQSVLLTKDGFVPILPGLGVSVLTFAGQRLGSADEGTRGPNGCWIAGASLDIFLLWRSCSGQCYVHLRSWGSTGGAGSKDSRAGMSHCAFNLLRCWMNLCWQRHWAVWALG